jgi:hypothetical protein
MSVDPPKMAVSNQQPARDGLTAKTRHYMAGSLNLLTTDD